MPRTTTPKSEASAPPAELVLRAKAIPKEDRERVFYDMPETDLHRHLKLLYQSMEPDYTVEVTHGPEEFGKDLVIVREDKVTLDVIGVVVKKGDIRGRTKGEVDEVVARVASILERSKAAPVDEVRSQIQQALSHAAELRSVFDRLPVSQVLVVLAGYLSKRARDRILAEMAKNVSIRDMRWLVDTFSQYYPQVFFDAVVVDFVRALDSRLEKHYLSEKRGMPLSECFVDPVVAHRSVPLSMDESLRIQATSRTLKFAQLEQLLKPGARLLLFGDPGTGKSSALAKIALDLDADAYTQAVKSPDTRRPRLPIFLTAAELLKYESVGAMTQGYFGTLVLTDKADVAAILVDGLDEVAEGQRKEVLELAERFADEIDCALVVTTRKTESSQLLASGFDRYELLPFVFQQALNLLKKLARNQESFGAIRSALEDVKQKIPLSPLSVILLLDLVEEHREVPASLTELYDRYLDMAMGRWDREKGIRVLFDYFVKKTFLGALAYYEFFLKKRLQMHRNEFDDFLANHAERYGFSLAEKDAFLSELQRSGVLHVYDEVEFGHRSFLEFFVAFHISENHDGEDLERAVVDLYFDPVWSEVAFYIVGLRRRIEWPQLERIFDHVADGDHVLDALAQRLLVGRLLQAGWHSEVGVKERAIRKAITYAPQLRDGIVEATKPMRSRHPEILGEVVVMLLSDDSFASGFLERPIREILKDVSVVKTSAHLHELGMLIWAQRRFLSNSERTGLLKAFAEKAKEVAAGDAKEEARLLSVALIIERHETALFKAIVRQLNRAARRAPKAVRQLYAKPKRGFKQVARRKGSKGKSTTQ